MCLGSIFDKALMEPKFGRMYSYLCLNLDEHLPTFEATEEGGRQETFKRG
jgi:hypothetical protein